MKIIFDENISPYLVAAVRCLERDRSIELSSVREGMSDPAWMFQFRHDGGTAMISGDHNILQAPINLAAYTASGLISIWPPPGWPNLKIWGQSALLIRWWPFIKLRIRESSKGDRWRIPLQWTPTLEGFKPLRDPPADIG